MCRKWIHLMLVLALVLLADVANADIDTDLVGYWKLDDNASDSSGSGYNGEEFGNPSYVPGIIGEAMDFDGPEQSVYIPEFTAIQNQDAVTVCMWVKPDRNTGTDQVMWFTDEDGSYGRVRFGVNGDEWEFKHGGSGVNVDVDDGDNPMVLGEWVHLVGVRKNNDRLELFVDGRSAEKKTFGVAGVAEPQASIGAERRSPTDVRTPFDGVIDEVRFYARALSVADIKELLAFAGESPVAASNPDPADGQTDVPRDAVLRWVPGDLVPALNGHKVYLGENFTDVSDGIGGITQSAGSYTPPQRFDFSTTYYWRVDEVDGPPDYAVHEGAVWSFTTEPVSYAIDDVVATASSSEAGKGPGNTVNGSGLDDSDLLHSNDGGSMWLSNILGPQPTWIQYEFDDVYKLHEMWVWNSNSDLEQSIGFGAKDVSIEYSVDGIDYITLGTTHEFSRAPGAPDYAHNTTVDLGGLIAKYVRVTVNSNWGGFLPQFGLSEVRFFYIPLRPREPHPDSGATDVEIDVTLAWRAGREAARHDVYLSTDEQAVIDRTAAVSTVTEASYSTLLDMATTYYWRIDEVNDTETPTMLPGDIWSFSTQAFFVVDDFESYNDIPAGQKGSNLVYETWLDGYGTTTNGSAIGYTVPFEPTMETGIVHGGEQSVPLTYDNSVASVSEVTVNPGALAIGGDWTTGVPQTLVLWFHGSSANAVTERMYVKVNGVKVVYPGAAANVARARWNQWNIDLAALNTNLGNVTQLSIGFERTGATGGTGTVLIDDIRLYRSAPEIVVPSEEIWIEAEATASITAPMKVYDSLAASAGRYIGTDESDGDSTGNPPATGIATYTFTVAGGTYKVSGRINIPNANNSFWVRIQGATTPAETELHSSGWVRWNDPPAVTNWFWNDVFSDDDDQDATVLFTMPAGTYTLEIARREAGAMLDAIVISKVD